MSNQFSKTIVQMDAHDADTLLINTWETARYLVKDELNDIIKASGLAPSMVGSLVHNALNAYEDALRAEWGIIPRKPEGEE